MSASGGLSAEVQTGDLRRSLVALRDFLAGQIAECDSKRDVAALTQRLLEVLARLDALPAPAEGTVLDELAARRASGDAVTARPARTRRG